MTTEQLVREVLQAKAAEVRPEQVDMPFPVAVRVRRPVRAGLAVVVAAAVAAILVATWVIAAPSGDTRQRAAAAGSGSSGPASTTAAGRVGSAPFQVPVGWSGVTASATDRYTAWCVADKDAGSDPCPGVMVYVAAVGRTVPLDDALVPACDAASTVQKLVTPVTVDGRPGSMVSQQCTPTDPAWLVWRTSDGALAVVAEKGKAANTAAAEILSGGVQLPGTPPAVASGTVSSDPPVASTSTCPPTPRERPAMVTNFGAAESTAPIAVTESGPADDGCPAG